ncbi:rifin [Plasmodium reichenowi]|uniref:Rifin n=1 Tax=Plasmodium reichenowi TaxID=5854 RepID=A0A060RMI3_PLARE|nr:rifin [Plasmodium reichenowi]
MKFHYINILLFALPLNILVTLCHAHNKNKPYITPQHTPTTRSLCECELYARANYDNDPEMKEVMQQFDDRTTQRFHEYDERGKTTRQKCKEQCDKEIQKIILKDKLEKQMAEQFSRLHTDIQSDAIPTCVCEKSVADKVEKGCLRCGGVLGGGVAPGVGILGGIGEAAMSAWKVAALKAAARYAMKEGVAKGLAAGNARGMEIIRFGLQHFGVDQLGIGSWERFLINGYNINIEGLANVIFNKLNSTCSTNADKSIGTMCKTIRVNLGILGKNGEPLGAPNSTPVIKALNNLAGRATQAAKAEADQVRTATTAAIKTEQTGVINTICGTWDTAITASVVAIVVIILVMLIIYLVLRYRRKRKMKKKLQYIKLLEE